jgi:hypothetical protein
MMELFTYADLKAKSNMAFVGLEKECQTPRS